MPGFTSRRSTTTSTVWFLRLSRRISSSRLRSSPSMRARVNPCCASFSSSFLNSPLRPRTMGASTITPLFGAQFHDALHDLLGRLPRDRPAALGTMRRSHRGVEQAQIVVDFGDGAYRRAGAAAGGLLFDGNGGRKAVDGVHVRTLHLVQKLPGVGGQSLDVPPLAFGINRVEGQRRFPRTAEAGDHRQRIAGNLYVDVLQIVLARAAHRNPRNGHGRYRYPPVVRGPCRSPSRQAGHGLDGLRDRDRR